MNSCQTEKRKSEYEKRREKLKLIEERVSLICLIKRASMEIKPLQLEDFHKKSGYLKLCTLMKPDCGYCKGRGLITKDSIDILKGYYTRPIEVFYGGVKLTVSDEDKHKIWAKYAMESVEDGEEREREWRKTVTQYLPYYGIPKEKRDVTYGRIGGIPDLGSYEKDIPKVFYFHSFDWPDYYLLIYLCAKYKDFSIGIPSDIHLHGN